MIKMFNVLIIVKKKQFSRTNILIQERSIMLKKQAFLDFKNIFMMPKYQDGKLVKVWDIGYYYEILDILDIGHELHSLLMVQLF